jgi:hypothetical protein
MRLNPDFFEDPESDPESQLDDAIQEITKFSSLPAETQSEIYQYGEQVSHMIATAPKDVEDPMAYYLGFQAMQINALQKSLVKAQKIAVLLAGKIDDLSNE